DGTLLYESPAASRVLGYDAKENTGRAGLDIVHPEDREAAAAVFQNVMANPGVPFEMVNRLTRKDGTYIVAEGTVTNLLHVEGVNAIVSNIRDVTARKEAEDALVENNAELKKSNSELDKFVYSVSHDLRAPLCSMKGVVEITERRTEDPFLLRNMGMMKKSIDRLDKFIGDILDYSRNMRMDMCKEPVDFKEMIDEITANLEFMGGSNRKVDIRMEMDVAADFDSDPGRIAIVLNNLVSNAIRYQNPGVHEPFVDIRVHTNETQACIVVKDNGIGIAKDKLTKVFDMFYRVSESSVGSGLGLYIVKETIDKLHGTIELESEPGVGTTFKILIPNFHN
ncbi:MAG TPA: PAS domain-containing sensor histidine kinase, partial [Chitinophagales bacterium]|nr:PAS domain-containing sensor histidine kinase [Chitinophagales bacterium]